MRLSLERDFCMGSHVCVSVRVWVCLQVCEMQSAEQSCCASLSPCCAQLRTSSTPSQSAVRVCGVCAAACASVGLQALDIDFLTSPPAPIVTPTTGSTDFTICIPPPTTAQTVSLSLSLSLSFSHSSFLFCSFTHSVAQLLSCF